MNIFTRRITYGIELSTLILGLLICMTFYNIQRAAKMEFWLKHSNIVLIHTSRIQLMTVNCEMIVRDYILTGDETRPVEFKKASLGAVEEMNTLKLLTADNTALQKPLDSAALYIGSVIAYSRNVMKRAKRDGSKAALLLTSPVSKSLFEKASHYIELVQEDESRLLAMRQVDSKKWNLIMNFSFCFTVSFIVIMIVTSLLRSKRELIERGRLVEDLIKNSERMNMAERLGSFGAWSINLENWIITSSDEMYRIWGYEPGKQESTLENYLLKVHPEDQAFVKQKMQGLTIQRNADYYDFRLVENGKIKYIRTGVTVTRAADDSLLSITGYAQDITEKTIASIKQEESNKELSILFNRIGDVLFSRDMISNTFIQISSTCVALYGYTLAEFKAEPDLFMTTIHPADRHVLESGNAKLERGEESVNRYRIIRRDNGIRWVENKIIPTFDQGKLVRIDGVIRDVTSETLINAEREKFIADLLHQNKTLEQFTYIVSHNLRVPVANVSGLCQILKTSLNVYSDEDQNVILNMLTSVSHLDQIIRDLNEILQTREHINEKKEIINLTGLINQLQQNFQSLTIHRNIEIKYNFKKANLLFSIRSYLLSICHNLILNSINFRRENEKTIINITTNYLDGQIEILFTDNGKGIDLSKNGSLLFGLYRRFDNSIEGKGMGLFMVKSILDHGSEFSVKFPLSKAEL